MVNGSRKEIWRINKQFLDTQIAKRKTIRLSHNPNVKWEGFYDKELKYLKDNKLKPRTDLYIYFSNYEEIGHGVSVFPEDLDEFIAVDIGLVAGEDAHGDEKKVNIIAKDSRSPYDYTLRKKLQEAADKNKIQYTVGVHNRYGSDATTAILQGFDFKYACIGPNVDATHHYERCHNDGIVETVKLLIAYL